MKSTTKSTKGRVFRDPIHGLIDFSDENSTISRILDTGAMQRLRRIKQMGLAWLVYTGAEHSRFGHALGAFHIADKISKNLALDLELAQLIKVAALVHDIGHGPFSHAWEEIYPQVSHETWGARICKENEELQEAFYSVRPELGKELFSFWDKTFKPSFASKLVSSQLDVDRLDYLLRDGHYSGVGYATYDLEWILHALRLERVDKHEPDLVIDYRRGMHAVEQYLFARSYMYAQVYHHKTVRAAETLFWAIMTRFNDLVKMGKAPSELEVAAKLANGNTITADEYLRLDDTTVVEALKNWAGLNGDRHRSQDPTLQDLSLRFIGRRLFKTIEIPEDVEKNESLLKTLEECSQNVFGEHGGYYVRIDQTKERGYNNQPQNELHVVGHPNHKNVTLGELLQDLPLSRLSRKTRLIYAPELMDKIEPLIESMNNN